MKRSIASLIIIKSRAFQRSNDFDRFQCTVLCKERQMLSVIYLITQIIMQYNKIESTFIIYSSEQESKANINNVYKFDLYKCKIFSFYILLGFNKT